MTDERHDENGRTQALTERVLKKMRGEERRGVSFASITVAVSAITALGGFGVLAMDAGAQKQRIETIEKRQIEDREVGSHKLNKLENKVEKIDGNVNLILQEIRAMQAEQRARERGRREDR